MLRVLGGGAGEAAQSITDNQSGGPLEVKCVGCADRWTFRSYQLAISHILLCPSHPGLGGMRRMCGSILF